MPQTAQPFEDLLYRYRADSVRVVDGDTLDLVADLGMRVRVDLRVRLAGVNAAEKGTDSGDAAKRAAVAWFRDRPGPYLVRTVRDRTEKFGRMMAEVIAPDGSDLIADMTRAGYLTGWDGKGTRPVPKWS